MQLVTSIEIKNKSDAYLVLLTNLKKNELQFEWNIEAWLI